MANTIRNTLITLWVAAMVPPKSARIAGSAGINISEETGPSALAAANKAVSPREAGSAAGTPSSITARGRRRRRT